MSTDTCLVPFKTKIEVEDTIYDVRGTLNVIQQHWTEITGEYYSAIADVEVCDDWKADPEPLVNHIGPLRVELVMQKWELARIA